MTYKDLQIAYEDNHILVVVKPYNVPVMKDDSGDPDMQTLIKQYLIDKYNKPGDAYVGIVHRLDRPTGGVMVFAKTSKAAERLSKAIQEKNVEKRYFAIVEGTPRYRADKLIGYLKKFEEDGNIVVKMVPALEEGAKYAELDYKTLSTRNNMSLLQVNLVTGRPHQIRVQLAAAGHPIVGDRKYNPAVRNCPMCLWAVQLRFQHPISGQTMVFRSYPPEFAPWTMFDLDAFLSVTLKNSDLDDDDKNSDDNN